MKRKLALIGGGGHAVSLMEMMPGDVDVAGYVDVRQRDSMVVPYLGNDDEFACRYPEMPVHIAFVMDENGSMALRKKVIDSYRNHDMPVLVAQSALVTSHSALGRGCAVMHRAVINSATLGECNVVNTGAIVEHGVTTGSNVFIGPGVVVCGGVTIGCNVMIGAGAVIRNNVTIADDSVIGMGSVVTKDIQHSGVYAGNPCKKL